MSIYLLNRPMVINGAVNKLGELYKGERSYVNARIFFDKVLRQWVIVIKEAGDTTD